MRMWQDQVARMERYYRRCERIKASCSMASVEDDNDTIYSFFMHCYHLRDWFNRDVQFKHRPMGETECQNKKCAECYLRKTPALKLCQEICNAIKHLNRSSDSAVAGRHRNHVDGSVSFYVSLPDGTERDAFDVVAEARAAWKEFVIASGDWEMVLYGMGENASDCAYDAYFFPATAPHPDACESNDG